MKTDDLIQKLSGDLKPVVPMPSPLRMTVFFSSIGLALIGMSFIFMSSRRDLMAQLSNPKFLFELTTSFVLAVTALVLSTFLSRPGRVTEIQKLQKLTVAFLIFVFGYDIVRVAQLSQNEIPIGLSLSGIECFLVVFGYSIMLAAAVLNWLRRGASVNPKLSGLVIGTASVALGNVTITFFCGIDNGLHIFLWHFAFPMLAAVSCSAIASRFLLRW